MKLDKRYTEKQLNDFKKGLINNFKKGLISIDKIRKAKRDISKLAMRMVTDKNGVRRKVWVKVMMIKKLENRLKGILNQETVLK